MKEIMEEMSKDLWFWVSLGFVFSYFLNAIAGNIRVDIFIKKVRNSEASLWDWAAFATNIAGSLALIAFLVVFVSNLGLRGIDVR